MISPKPTEANYHPLCWEASEERAHVFTAHNLLTDARCKVFAYADGSYRVLSDTEALYDVDPMLGCSCPDFEHRAAKSRLCKHGAAVAAVENL